MTKIISSNHPSSSPPGNLIYRLFLTAPEGYKTTLVLPLQQNSRRLRILCWVSSWSLFLVFAVAFGFDVADIVSGGYLPNDFQKANPMIGVVSYCASQVDLLAACCATLFLLVKKNDIFKSAQLLEHLTTDYPESRAKIKGPLRRARIYFGLHDKLSVLLDNIIFKRQTTCIRKPSKEEISLMMTLMERFEAKTLLFSAAGLMDLGPVAVTTLLAGVFAFAFYVMDRAQRFVPRAD
ncbi:hypothetical protein BV898_07109 [Hypsibius exemplaris]|uniref:Uncharacterized protein n=1 Tax=Hypsibius exemplaris TaxID=2072580 RepID=A0A1W0WUH6_HYPEX|nr:hypothetical protein BV898_07109 [Hypsibius exemplaris]